MSQNPLPRMGLNDDGSRWFDRPCVLLDRIELKISVFDEQVRAEMWQLKGAEGPGGHLIWQHRADIPHTTDTATTLAAHYLDSTAGYLATIGYPGLIW